MGHSPEYERALQRAMRLCARMERSSGQVRAYLSRGVRQRADKGAGAPSGGGVACSSGWGVASSGGEKRLSQVEINEIIEELKRGEFIDDHRFALAYIKEKCNGAKWGEYKVRQGLKVAGVADDVANDAFAELKNEGVLRCEESALAELLRAKYKSISGGNAPDGDDVSAGDAGFCGDGTAASGNDMVQRRKIAARLVRFAVSRGFSYSSAMNEIEKLGLL